MKQGSIVAVLATLALSNAALGQDSIAAVSIVKQNRAFFEKTATQLIGTWTRTSESENDRPNELVSSWVIGDKFVRIEGRLDGGKTLFYAMLGYADQIKGPIQCWTFQSNGAATLSHLTVTNLGVQWKLELVAKIPVWEAKSVTKGNRVTTDLKPKESIIRKTLVTIVGDSMDVRIEHTVGGETKVVEESRWKRIAVETDE